MRILDYRELRVGPMLCLAVALLVTSCSGGPSASNSNSSAPAATETPLPPPSPQTDFEKALQYVRNGQYTYVWVFSRKDGKPLEPTDSAFLRTNAPQVVDWAATDDKRKVVGGTNFNLEEGNLALLKKKYVVEDYSNR